MLAAYSKGRVCIVSDGARIDDVSCEVLKNHRFRYDGKLGAFVGPYEHFADAANELHWVTGDTIIRNFEPGVHEAWLASSRELRVKRRIVDWSLLKKPPLVGKPPFEDFQKIDITRGLGANRHVFAWDPGLGKSFATAALIENLIKQEGLGKCLVFSTRIGTFNLAHELKKFCTTLSHDDFLTISSINNIKDRDVFNSSKCPQRVLIMPYDALKSIMNYYYDAKHGTARDPHPSRTVKYRKCPVDLKPWLGDAPAGLFLDESHSIANAKTARFHAFSFIVDYFEYRYLFSATVADKHEKLYAQLRVLDPALTRHLAFDDWISYYNEVGNRWSPLAINEDKWREDRLKELDDETSRDYVSKRTKTDCLTLPEYTRKNVPLEMSDKHRKLYEAMSDEAIRQQVCVEGAAGTIRTMFPFFLLSCENPKVIEKSERFEDFSVTVKKLIRDFDFQADFSKLDALDAIVEDEVDEKGAKGIVWTAHPLTTEFLVKRYAKRKPFVIDASTKLEDRADLVHEFEESDSKILIASIYVANTSVTIVKCTWECFFEKVMKFTDVFQAKGRIYRQGQTSDVTSYLLTYQRSLDAFVEANLAAKGKLLDNLFAGATVSQQKLKEVFNYEFTS